MLGVGPSQETMGYKQLQDSICGSLGCQSEDGWSQHPGRPVQGFPRAGPATLSLFQDKRIVSTLVAARHEGGHRAPQMWAAVHAEDRVTLSHTAGVQEELSHAWPSLLLVEGKVCAVHVPLSSGPW